ncbi:hypothetical protein, partial [Pseudogulbenkiania ferrooxidans]
MTTPLARATRCLILALTTAWPACSIGAALPDAVSPVSGPPAQTGRHVLLIAYDLRNGGISKTTRSFLNAAGYLHWQVKVADAKSSNDAVREQLLLQATAKDIAGVALIGADSAGYHLELAMLKQMGKIAVGWHAGSAPGANAEL